MFDNGCTIRLVPGSRVGMVTVLGDHEVSIRRTLKHVIRLVTDTCLAAAWTIETPNVTKRYDTEEEARKLAVETDVEMAAGAGCIEAFSGESGISGARRVFDMLENPTSLVSVPLSRASNETLISLVLFRIAGLRYARTIPSATSDRASRLLGRQRNGQDCLHVSQVQRQDPARSC